MVAGLVVHKFLVPRTFRRVEDVETSYWDGWKHRLCGYDIIIAELGKKGSVVKVSVVICSTVDDTKKFFFEHTLMIVTTTFSLRQTKRGSLLFLPAAA